MKYLRKIFESSEEETMIEDLKDILLELKDIGFETDVVPYRYIKTVGVINATISKPIQRFWDAFSEGGGFVRNDKEFQEVNHYDFKIY